MSTVTEFWQALEEAADPAAYRPQRRPDIIAARLETAVVPYYVLKQPHSKTYLRLSEADYATWWQMDGRKRVKDLLYYNLKRYNSLPFQHLTTLIAEMRAGQFFQDTPVNVYDQIEEQLAARQPASRGQKLLKGFLYSEYAVTGLDGPFGKLYRWVRPLFHPIVQTILLALILIGAGLFLWLFQRQAYPLVSGGWGILTMILANTVVLAIHETAHGLATKHIGRELDRGGFLIYMGMPAFFVDTRDIWLSPRWQRILVTWAGPHSGLIVGSLTSFLLTVIYALNPAAADTLWASFLYQIAFLAFLSVFINLNPLLELDGYFILMDWLEMPGLRPRSFHFWRQKVWPALKNLLPQIAQINADSLKNPAKSAQSAAKNQNLPSFWRSLDHAGRIFTFYGALSFIYSIVALWLALAFWQARIVPFVDGLWQSGVWGRLAVLALTAVSLTPLLYFTAAYGWNRLQTGLEWLARRDLLERPSVLAALVALPVFVLLPLLYWGMERLPLGEVWQTILTLIVYLSVIAAISGIARQLAGSRFQWAIWSLAIVPAGLLIAWLGRENALSFALGLLLAATAVFAAGLISWLTLRPRLTRWDWLLAGLFLWIGFSLFLLQLILAAPAYPLLHALIIWETYLGLALMAPLLLNFRGTRFALPWAMLIPAIAFIPWLPVFPGWDTAVILLWLYAVTLYLLVGALTQFSRQTITPAAVAAFSERDRLVNALDHFLDAFFASYEAVFGRRRLLPIQRELARRAPIRPADPILTIADRARQTILLAVDRLDDLAGTPFTRQAGQAAYDSLAWVEAETLARYVLAEIPLGAQLAQGFIEGRDRRVELVREADVFARLDQAGIESVTAVLHHKTYRKGQTIARAGQNARIFYLIDAGEVAVCHNGEQMAALVPGSYFGVSALAAEGSYQFDYRAQTAVSLLTLRRDDFDPLLRADTTLASQVQTGAQSRALLKQMPLFSGLSPQELAALDRQMIRRRVPAGEIIVRPGQPRSYLFIVAEGLIDVFIEEAPQLSSTAEGAESAEKDQEKIQKNPRNPRQKIIGQLGPGEHFGEYALFTDTPYPAGLRAASDADLLLLDEPKFDELAARYGRMAQYVAQIGSSRIMEIGAM
ncbi:MAG TPA: cyclic nucleotide-binding domain-containing protein [Anaerolineae bacterium]|nr:cyclic nucleotide-binding domain-containing protein [Anaerolineae bacterium]